MRPLMVESYVNVVNDSLPNHFGVIIPKSFKPNNAMFQRALGKFGFGYPHSAVCLVSFLFNANDF